MDKKIQILAHLYGEQEDGAELRTLLEDDEVRREYQAFSEVKFWLDHTKRSRPDASVLDDIFAAAGTDAPSEPPVGRVDRAPARSGRRRWIGFGVSGAVLTLLALIWLIPGGPSGPIGPESAAMESAPLEAGEQSVMLQRAEPAASVANGNAVADDAMNFDSLGQPLPELHWDQQNEIMRVQRRLDWLEARSGGLAWDRAAVPLESLTNDESSQPTLYPGARRQQAGSRNQ